MGQNINRGDAGKLCTERKKQNKKNDSVKRLLGPKRRRDLKKKKRQNKWKTLSNLTERSQQVNGLRDLVEDKIVRVDFLNDSKVLAVFK